MKYAHRKVGRKCFVVQLRQKKDKPPKAEKSPGSSGGRLNSFRVWLKPIHGLVVGITIAYALFGVFPSVEVEMQKLFTFLAVFSVSVSTAAFLILKAWNDADDKSKEKNHGFMSLLSGLAVGFPGVFWAVRISRTEPKAVETIRMVETFQVLVVLAVVLAFYLLKPKTSVAVAPALEVAYEEPSSVVASEPVSEATSWMDRARSDQPDTSFTPESEMPAFAARSRFNPNRGLDDEIFGEQGQAAHA